MSYIVQKPHHTYFSSLSTCYVMVHYQQSIYCSKSHIVYMVQYPHGIHNGPKTTWYIHCLLSNMKVASVLRLLCCQGKVSVSKYQKDQLTKLSQAAHPRVIFLLRQSLRGQAKWHSLARSLTLNFCRRLATTSSAYPQGEHLRPANKQKSFTFTFTFHSFT